MARPQSVLSSEVLLYTYDHSELGPSITTVDVLKELCVGILVAFNQSTQEVGLPDIAEVT